LIENFSNRKFCKSILDLAQAYGPLSFWTENIAPDCNPDATWRALLVVAVLKEKRFAGRILAQLEAPDSRVRAWACTALALLEFTPALPILAELTRDASCRVRQRAIEAVLALGGGERLSLQAPLQVRQGRPEAPAAPLREAEAARKPVVAIVSEDGKGSREFYDGFLSGLGYQVHLCPTETETIDQACKLHPDLILTDNQKYRDNLSGLNMTWDLCRLQQLRETLIFMVTADELESVFLWSGGDDFFTKPLDMERLEKTLGAYFQPA
jgi:CheY-like chemotaxis protein